MGDQPRPPAPPAPGSNPLPMGSTPPVLPGRTPNPNANVANQVGDPFRVLTPEELAAPIAAASNKVATREQIIQIVADLNALGFVGDPALGLFDLAFHCYDIGSSPSAQPVGASPFGCSRMQVAAVVRNHCTLRQLCMFYAPSVWNKAVKDNRPPGNWANLQFTPETKFAAFDFFDGVLNPASQQVALWRQPTPQEIYASATHKDVATYRAASKAHDRISNSTLLTKGASRSTPPALMPGPDA
nr:coat protein [Strawberry mild yellow edge virus]